MSTGAWRAVGCVIYFKPNQGKEIEYSITYLRDALAVIEGQRRFYDSDEAWEDAKQFCRDGIAAYMAENHPHHKPH